jgi:multimeric flavodoxin WrbA
LSNNMMAFLAILWPLKGVVLMIKKNVLVLTGSPRKNGNSDRMAEAFIRGAVTAGHDVIKFETAAKKIGGCKGCKKCWSKDRPCVNRDDFDLLSPLLEGADVLVFCTPLYWFTFSAPLKAAIERIYAYLRDNRQRSLKIKESFLFVCGADSQLKIFDGIIATYKEIVSFLKWTDRGILAIPKVSEVGDIEHTDALIKAEELGKTV